MLWNGDKITWKWEQDTDLGVSDGKENESHRIIRESPEGIWQEFKSERRWNIK